MIAAAAPASRCGCCSLLIQERMVHDPKASAPWGSPRGQGPPRMRSGIAVRRCLLFAEKVASFARRMRCFLTSRTMVIPFLHRSTSATADAVKRLWFSQALPAHPHTTKNNSSHTGGNQCGCCCLLVLARPRRMQTRTLQSGRENTNEGFATSFMKTMFTEHILTFVSAIVKRFSKVF